jgi:hypothetical protein
MKANIGTIDCTACFSLASADTEAGRFGSPWKTFFVLDRTGFSDAALMGCCCWPLTERLRGNYHFEILYSVFAHYLNRFLTVFILHSPSR